MPIIAMPIELLLSHVNDGAAERLSEGDLPDLVTNLGCEVEEVTETTQYLCIPADKIYDRTEAQGPPLVCSVSGIDFREQPDALKELGTNKVVRLDMLAVRPDIFDPGGMGRMIRAYQGTQSGLIEYPVSPAKLSVKVDPRLGEDSSRRPYISCAVLRNVSLTHDLIKMLMNLQEDLHWALGRDRKLASIGVYDLDKLSGATFAYDSVDPDELTFVPLGFAPDSAGLTPRQILEQHKTGQAYAHLLKAYARYPLLRDGAGTVLSMPPIINSEGTRVTMQSTNLFCDVTGLSQRTVDRALNVLVTSLKEVLPEIEIEQVTIETTIGGVDGSRTTPDLTPSAMMVDIEEARATIGAELDATALSQLLERMGHGVSINGNRDTLQVKVPAWRNDVMHPIDLIEDAAVAYGYNNLVPDLVPTFTVGQPRLIEEQSATARQIFTGLGFHQVMTLVLSNEQAAYGKWLVPPHPQRVIIDNPISSEQTICRTALLPGILETLAINRQYDLPQYLFEIGDCSFVNEGFETGAGEERFAAAAMIGSHIGYADIRAVADAFSREMDREITVAPADHPSYIPGRIARLISADGSMELGVMGEIHPEVLEAYSLRHPVAALELSLAKLLA